MRMKHNKKLIKALCLSIALLLLSSVGALAEDGKKELKRIEVTGGELIINEPALVARDIGRGKNLYFRPSWCGDIALLFEVGKRGVLHVDLETRIRRYIVSGTRYSPVNCSPDGKWAFIYYDRRNIEEEKWLKRNPWVRESFVPPYESGDWLFRYNFETGERQKIADKMVGFNPAMEWLSPDKKKFFLGSNYSLVEGVDWFGLEPLGFSDKNWNSNDASWFFDSSGVAAIILHPYAIGVEVFGEEGWSNVIELEEKYGGFFRYLKVDNQKMVYFAGERANNRWSTVELVIRCEEVDGEVKCGRVRNPEKLPDLKWTLYRCEVDPSGMRCDDIMKRENIGYFEVLPGGDIVMEDDGCIRIFPPGTDVGKCIVLPHKGAEIEFIGISPKRRWLAYYERMSIISESEGDDYRPYDLYVSELKWNKSKKER